MAADSPLAAALTGKGSRPAPRSSYTSHPLKDNFRPSGTNLRLFRFRLFGTSAFQSEVPFRELPDVVEDEDEGTGDGAMMVAAGPEEERRRQQLRPNEMEDEEVAAGGAGHGEETLQLNLGDLDLTSEEFILDEVDIHIQANLEDALVQEALKTGVDLRQYSKQVELELQQIENASIKDYIKESKNIASLHTQITACDAVLERMEAMLSSFQSDLSSISCEIQTLQEQSVAMNVRLRNRQAVRGRLSQLVDELVVPNLMIRW
ncbi:vacuolar protein sorting-associated protein 52 homolog, partial [Heteronotia binoei]|uniref:vacuolar protein sorting-associated protein 52 homolog n=1 Tax=Heteronotia binoei TaxID=13085 RepID=UPI00292DD79A